MTATIHHGDCLDVLRAMPDNSVHAIVTDPPYGLSNTTPEQVADTIVRWVSGDREYLPSGKGFMGKSWDAFVPPVAVWDEAMRVLKPGGHVLAFAGTRTMDLMTLGIRLAGFDIRDSVAWLYGSGFPKSMDVSKAIDKAAGVEREVTGMRKGDPGTGLTGNNRNDGPSADAWRQERQAAKGLYEARDIPATDAARRWRGWGTSLKPAFEPIVMARKPPLETVAASVLEHGTGALNIDATRARDGRWPPNVSLDEQSARMLDEAGGESRFFYVQKAPAKERPVVAGVKHPAVKPLTLMQWLVRLVTPPNGIVLDPFAGSGTTIEAAMLEGFDCIGIEREAEYLPLIRHRIERATEQLNTRTEAPDQGAFPLEDIA